MLLKAGRNVSFVNIPQTLYDPVEFIKAENRRIESLVTIEYAEIFQFECFSDCLQIARRFVDFMDRESQELFGTLLAQIPLIGIRSPGQEAAANHCAMRRVVDLRSE